jgi:hypothetical protein
MPYFGLKPEYRTFCWPWWKQYLSPKTYCYAVKYFVQRGLRGWANCDTWSLYDYLNEVLPEAIGHLKYHTHSIPMSITEEEWNKILTEIQVGFFASRSIADAKYENRGQLKELTKTQNKGLHLFAKWYGDLWD